MNSSEEFTRPQQILTSINCFYYDLYEQFPILFRIVHITHDNHEGRFIIIISNTLKGKILTYLCAFSQWSNLQLQLSKIFPNQWILKTVQYCTSLMVKSPAVTIFSDAFIKFGTRGILTYNAEWWLYNIHNTVTRQLTSVQGLTLQ